MAATYEFQPPPNLAAIRYTIGKHIQKQRAKPCEHDSPPPTDSPSLPTETETQDNLTMPQADLDKDTIIQKIKDLQEEKHKLFGLMRTLLAAPCKEKKQPLPLTSDPASAQKSADETKTEERKRNPPQGRLRSRSVSEYPTESGYLPSSKRSRTPCDTPRYFDSRPCYRLPPPPAGSPILIMPSSAPKHYMPRRLYPARGTSSTFRPRPMADRHIPRYNRSK